jgi:hypothetical protein
MMTERMYGNSNLHPNTDNPGQFKLFGSPIRHITGAAGMAGWVRCCLHVTEVCILPPSAYIKL